ncbi:PAS-domain containing protein [Novosphingobium mangrovi (ex Huang et al. 2023)]|uniref:histidine kinase n=1 Tax=Novosphingobium mangrovi (ex Huang et al. 2023) TaxID=2976432 RepID=A0ABT2I1T9_9SPHN|nr:PAS-domain containing protein [Novosphingobium mangrovi (ex Huang et al. 2023)]MCT2398771.1 PAS-domain containing protein [Novosphingobium mangrovi (ex Huang et al. 2023)]
METATDIGELEELRRKVARLEKINAALIDRVERSTDIQGGAFSMFETAISLEARVRDRTSALEEALERLNAANAELASAHAAASSTRTLLRDAIESLSDGFALFDKDDRMVLCNRAFLQFFPYFESISDSLPEFSELATRFARSGEALASRDAPERWLKDRLARHRLAQGAHVQALADGRWLQINELKTSDGGTVGIYTDITLVKAEDARQRARELAERNLALQSTLDTLSEGVCLFDAQRRLQAWNEGMLAVLDIGDIVPGSGPETHEALTDWCVRNRGLDCPGALCWREGDAERVATQCMMGDRHFTVRSVPLKNGGMVFTFDDVTDHVRFQRSLTETAETLERRVTERTAELVEVNRQLVEAKNEAETANRSKTSFIAAASHDLLQPLNAARLFVSAMDGQEMPARPRSLVQQASTALDSVEDLLEALFEISRLDAGAIQPEFADLSLNTILRALRIEFAPLAQSGGLELEMPETRLWVRSDPRLLRRVLQNFVSNAIRYTENGSVRVELCEQGEDVVVTVRDTGPGIAAADRDEIFEEFRRLSKTQKIPGKGLGLAIVRRVTTMLGHEIGLESAPGEGAAFSIRLPRAEPVAETGSENAAAAGGNTRAGGLVLVVDNDPAVLSGMEALLENWSLDVVAVNDPSDPAALAAIDQGPAMFIVDYHLDNDLTGEKAVAMLRERAGSNVPAMIITADRGAETKAQLASLSLPVLNKPVKPAKLRALLRQLDIL